MAIVGRLSPLAEDISSAYGTLFVAPSGDVVSQAASSNRRRYNCWIHSLGFPPASKCRDLEIFLPASDSRVTTSGLQNGLFPLV